MRTHRGAGSLTRRPQTNRPPPLIRHVPLGSTRATRPHHGRLSRSTSVWPGEGRPLSLKHRRVSRTLARRGPSHVGREPQHQSWLGGGGGIGCGTRTCRQYKCAGTAPPPLHVAGPGRPARTCALQPPACVALRSNVLGSHLLVFRPKMVHPKGTRHRHAAKVPSKKNRLVLDFIYIYIYRLGVFAGQVTLAAEAWTLVYCFLFR